MIRNLLFVLALLLPVGAFAQSPAPPCGGTFTPGDLVVVGSQSQLCWADGGALVNSGTSLIKLTATAISSNSAMLPVVPAGCTLIAFTAQETSGNAVTGGIILGTSIGGSQIYGGSPGSPATLTAGGTLTINPPAFSLQQLGGATLYIGSSNWGSAVVTAQAYCLLPKTGGSLVTATASGMSANTALAPAFPANCTLILVTAQEVSHNAVTGGIILGTSSGGTQLYGTSPGLPATLTASGALTINSSGFSLQQIGGSTVWFGSSNWGSAVVNGQAYCLLE